MKKTRLTRALCAVSACALLVGCLAGCGGGTKSGSDYVYVPTITELSGVTGGMNSVSVQGERVYFTSSVMKFSDGTPLTEEEQIAYSDYWNNKYSRTADAVSVASGTSISEEAGEGSKYENVEYVQELHSMKLDGTDLQSYSEYTAPKSEDDYGYAGINAIRIDPNGAVWVLENYSKTIFNLPAGFDETTQDRYEYYDHDEETYLLKKLTSTGATETTIDLSSLKPEDSDYFSIYNMVIDGSGNVILADSNAAVSIYNAAGEFQFTIPGGDGNYIDSLSVIHGKPYAMGYSDKSDGNGYVLREIDTASRSFGTEQSVPDNAWNFMDGGSNYDFSYTNGASLFGYKFGDAEPTKILSWLSCDLNSDNVVYSTIKENDDVMAICNDYSENISTCYIVNLVKTPAADVKLKQTLTMACMYVDYDLRAKILEFNKSDADFRIEMVDYSEFNSDDDYTAGLTKLNTEIISGNAPDIIAIDGFEYDQYAAKGLLEDLYTYMDKGDVKKSDFVPSTLAAQETDGKLYRISSGFYPVTLVGSSDVLGTEQGWTMQEMQDIINQHSEADYVFGYDMTSEQMLQLFLSSNYENYIDWATGKCSFDSDEFKGLLTFAKTFPTNDDIMAKYESEKDNYTYISEKELVSTGRQLMSYCSLWDFNAVQDLYNTYGDKLISKGFPCADKQGVVARFSGTMAITSTCANKEGAWQFISSLLTEKAQENQYNGLPVNQKTFDKNLKKAMTQEYDENGKPISYGGWSDGSGNEFNYYALTEAQGDFVKNLVSSVSGVLTGDDSALTLITEAVKPFFDGSKTVDAVCSELQSKMTMYVNEKR